jgi:signal transduction histidine kinase
LNVLNRRQPSGAALLVAGIVVITSLVALVLLPLIVTRRTDLYRAANERRAEPARAALNEINYGLSLQIAALTRAAVTREPEHMARYRGEIVPQDAALQMLAKHRGRMGEPFDTSLRELQRRIGEWRASVQQSVDLQRLAFDEHYPAVIEAVHRVDESITAYQTTQRAEVRRLGQMQVWVTGVLVLLAALAASLVMWMVTRLRTLASMFAEESSARQTALEQQQELVRVRDEILGVVAHDLRSPLTTITLSTQLLPGSPAEEQAEHVDTILSTTKRMQRLIQDLLDVTKLENTKLSIRRDPIDPGVIAREVAASQMPIATSKEIALEASIDDPLPHICGDADRLAQALTNLIGNALKFTPAGGKVQLAVKLREPNIRFTVTDSGSGIAASDLPHLFEPFWQAKKTAHLGAGLGLKITRAIVEAHDGRIEVQNVPAGGACFTFDLPIWKERSK